jgi:CDP-diglyceride synthetase
VTLSLYGVFDHNDHWDPKWNYWYIARPLVGIILAIIAYFIFITLINSTGLTPRTSATTTTSTTLGPTTTAIPTTSATPTAPPTGQTGGNATGPSTLLLYYVLAFIVGFREDTFRSLVKRAADVLLGPR